MTPTPNLPRPSRSTSQQGGPSSSVDRDTSWRSTSFDFSRPGALMELEEYDDDIAAITRSSPCYENSTANGTSASDGTNVASDSTDPDNETRSLPSSVDSTTMRVHSVRREDLRRINLIGIGRFSKVHLSSGPSWLNSTESRTNERRPPMLVAVKSLDTSRIENAEELTLAASELANEAKILSGLDHHNIVRLRGICSETFSSSFGWGGFFLVLEILQETLSDRLQQWRRQKHRKESQYKKAKGVQLDLSFSRILSKTRRLVTESTYPTKVVDIEPELEERIRRMHRRIQETVVGIVEGMEYLHSKGIVLRDLKPANIGYEDTSGVQYGISSSNVEEINKSRSSVRLFDFGMAQKVETCDPTETCGSLRYMSPEAMTGDGYTLKVDVYSFGVVLFEICSLCHPFAKTSKPTWRARQRAIQEKMFRKMTGKRSQQTAPEDEEDMLVEGHRHRFLAGEVLLSENMEKSVFCPELRALIEDCCDVDPTMRPDFTEIRSTLDSIFYKNSRTTTQKPSLTQPQ